MNKKYKEKQLYKTNGQWFTETCKLVKNINKEHEHINKLKTLNLFSQQIRRRNTLSVNGRTRNIPKKNLPGCLVRGELLRPVDNKRDRRSVADVPGLNQKSRLREFVDQITRRLSMQGIACLVYCFCRGVGTIVRCVEMTHL